jgi:hypothetical protein
VSQSLPKYSNIGITLPLGISPFRRRLPGPVIAPLPFFLGGIGSTVARFVVGVDLVRLLEMVWPEQKMRCRRTLLGALEVESGEVFTNMVRATPWGRDRSHPRTLRTDTIHECTVR